jgi:hypothetical protein
MVSTKASASKPVMRCVARTCAEKLGQAASLRDSIRAVVSRLGGVPAKAPEKPDASDNTHSKRKQNIINKKEI